MWGQPPRQSRLGQARRATGFIPAALQAVTKHDARPVFLSANPEGQK